MIQTQTIKLDQRYLTRIRSLDLEANVYNWRKILDMVKWPNLSKINLNYCEIGIADLKYLLVRQLDCLVDLKLDGNNIGMGVKLLIKINFPQLKKFTLNNCNLGEEGAKHLVKGYYPALTFLSLYNNNINPNGYLQLILMSSQTLMEIILNTKDHLDSNKIQAIILLNWVVSQAQGERQCLWIKNPELRKQLLFAFCSKSDRL